MPPHLLRRHLIEWRVSVVGDAAPDAVDILRAAGLAAERVEPDRYADYVVEQAPSPPDDWTTASHALEVAVLPSCANEAVLRLWGAGGRGGVQVAETGIHTWGRLFNTSPWCLDLRDEEPTQPDPFQESVEVQEGVARLVERAVALPVERPEAGILDGISYLLRARSPAGEVCHRGHCPSPTHQQGIYRLLSDLLSVIAKEVRHPRSREILMRAM